MNDDKSEMLALDFCRYPAKEMGERAAEFLATMQRRRSVRWFSDEPIPLAVVRDCIAAAATAPSGAHKQPWTFVLVTDPALKREIRSAAEVNEREFYGGRASARWREDLAPLATGAAKPFLEDAPALIAVFAQKHGASAEELHYYVNESVGIAVGILIAALHRAGLATLTYTPSPMKFLGRILARPSNERAFLLLPVGYPSAECQVPGLERKPLGEVLIER